MSNLPYASSGSQSVTNHATNWTAIAMYDTPANQKGLGKYAVYCKGTSGQTPVDFALRIDSDLSGATLSTKTPQMINRLDAETPQGQINSFTVQPTNKAASNGTTVATMTRQPTEAGVLRTIEVPGDSTLTLWAITATNACTVEWAFEAVE